MLNGTGQMIPGTGEMMHTTGEMLHRIGEISNAEQDTTVRPRREAEECLMSPPCLEYQGCHLVPLYYLLSCSSAKSCYSFCLIFLLPDGTF